ncbi:winged helix-turn-helix domain-containing protein [Patescibacteria group bacterium]|nr:winged helix-turn-helix domain-containing protein [Patescibacteria group bacterium]
MLKTLQIEKIVKGFANHTRIEMLYLIKENPELSLMDISKKLQINLKTASEHLRRMNVSGLIQKRNYGQSVLHKISPLGEDILEFIKKLQQ